VADLEKASDDRDKWLDVKEAAELLNIRETTFEALAARGTFPQGLHLTKRSVYWRREEILAVKVLMQFLLEKDTRRQRFSQEQSTPKERRERGTSGTRPRRRREQGNEGSASENAE